MKKLNRAERIGFRHYLYRGYDIKGFYYSSEGCVCWEAYDENGCGFAHSRSLSLTKILIDEDLDGITTK